MNFLEIPTKQHHNLLTAPLVDSRTMLGYPWSRIPVKRVGVDDGTCPLLNLPADPRLNVAVPYKLVVSVDDARDS